MATGNPDIGGSRASMAMMAAEALGIPVEQVRPVVADTASIGYSMLTGGSRTTFATGMAVVAGGARRWSRELKRARGADLGRRARPGRLGGRRGASASTPPRATQAADAGGPRRRSRRAPAGRSSAEVSLNAQGAGPGFASHICDVEVDRETGHVDGAALHRRRRTSARRSTRATSRARCRAAPRRASAGR